MLGSCEAHARPMLAHAMLYKHRKTSYSGGGMSGGMSGGRRSILLLYLAEGREVYTRPCWVISNHPLFLLSIKPSANSPIGPVPLASSFLSIQSISNIKAFCIEYSLAVVSLCDGSSKVYRDPVLICMHAPKLNT